MTTEERGKAAESRRTVVMLLLAAGGLSALGFGLRAARSTQQRSRSPWLRVHDGADPPRRSADLTLWLALATLSPAERSSILDEIEAAMASVEARLNPLLVDLVEDDVVDVFRRNQGWFLPLCTAASALLAASYEAPDEFCVQALAADSPRQQGDILAWKNGQEDARARRARFLAWPASRSIVVRAKSQVGVRRLESELRSACSRKESAIALVLDRLLVEGRSPDPRLDATLDRMAKAQKTVQGESDLILLPKRPEPGAPISSWVALEANEYLVVPKLSALSPFSRFESEIRERLRGTDGEVAGGPTQ